VVYLLRIEADGDPRTPRWPSSASHQREPVPPVAARRGGPAGRAGIRVGPVSRRGVHEPARRAGPPSPGESPTGPCRHGTHDIPARGERGRWCPDRPAGPGPTRTLPLYHWSSRSAARASAGPSTPPYALVVDSLVEAMARRRLLLRLRPHNACGTLLSAAWVRRSWACRALGVGGTVVVDDAYSEIRPLCGLRAPRGSSGASAGCLPAQTFSRRRPGGVRVRVTPSAGASWSRARSATAPSSAWASRLTSSVAAVVGSAARAARKRRERAGARNRSTHSLDRGLSSSFGGPPSSASFLLVAVAWIAPACPGVLLAHPGDPVSNAGHLWLSSPPSVQPRSSRGDGDRSVAVCAGCPCPRWPIRPPPP